jgi:hypothetical protein
VDQAVAGGGDGGRISALLGGQPVTPVMSLTTKRSSSACLPDVLRDADVNAIAQTGATMAI